MNRFIYKKQSTSLYRESIEAIIQQHQYRFKVDVLLEKQFTVYEV